MVKNKTQSGSTQMIITVALVVALTGALSFIIWQNVISPSKTTKTTSVDHNAAAVLVGNFYSEYVAIWNDPASVDTEAASTKADTLVAKYGTTNLTTEYSKPTDIDNVVCSNQKFGSQVITDHKIVGDVAIVTVNEPYLVNNENISVKVIDQNGPKIDSIVCPVSK